MIVVRLVVKGAMFEEEHKRFYRFRKIGPPHFDADPLVDAQYFLDSCEEIL